MLRAELDLARARLADRRDDPGAGPALASAVSRQPEDSTPYHLAHGLLDQTGHYLRHQNANAAASALAETRAIAASSAARRSWNAPTPSSRQPPAAESYSLTRTCRQLRYHAAAAMVTIRRPLRQVSPGLAGRIRTMLVQRGCSRCSVPARR
jgi:hypothetical protein